MPQLIGMDEAGYGPNLGPLVITATSWETAGDPRECDLYDLLSDMVTRTAGDSKGRLHVGDSKQVYSPTKGLRSLELTVLAVLRAAEIPTDTFHALWQSIAVERPSDHDVEPWHLDGDFSLPTACDAEALQRLSCRLADGLHDVGVGRPRVACDVVPPQRFNSLTHANGSKGQMLSRLSISLLRRLWDPEGHGGAFIICDKHGGRNRYDELLADVVDGTMTFCTAEGRELSAYRIGSSEVRFQTKAEVHFPVAVASLVSKYLRELSMLAFNRFWQRHLPDLKPTKGYPTDAKRFRAEITEKQTELNIRDDVLWRCK